ncbi:nucleotide exchange factor GrpE [filamentous cyanobacterium LEGE 11480]|uniref:Protein GrpE n=1 Tax=Romeriopsis navalis LEGE 11480 TaxID=2777977 RepID=A0A928Z3Y3_9CYAN|nr:nucleotide exchange factor GrpE [Romeriopsis navalis]MBE9031159.1 nucleotide exchange factor GrpE [Romeriopsis navalis LEGE 11480]
MTEENKPVEANQPSTDGPDASPEAGETATDAAETDAVSAAAETIPELIDPEALEDGAEASADAASAEAGEMDEETDFEAAFMELRSTYAAKERECEALKADVEDRQNQHLRLAADFENFRRRTQKEKEDLEIQVKCSTINELLSVVDNFERARAQIKPQNDGEMNLHKSYQGVYKDLVDRLKKVGVSPMRAEGQQFDPNYHNAVMREPTAEHPDGTVIEELMRGYLIGERVLRHAMVKVATPPEDGADENTDETPAEE